MPQPFNAEIEALLRFYADAGYSDALDDAPHDRFTDTAKRVQANARPGEPIAAASRANISKQPDRPPRPEAAPTRPAIRPTIPDEGQAALARELARSASSLDELRAILTEFDGCNLKFTAKQLVFADGNPEAKLMLIGEAPGRDEDLEGLPFVGRSGQLLDRILAAIGLDRSSVYIANIVPWRPPGNRDPSPLETEICRPFIERQIELVSPAILITLGGPSSKVMLNSKDGIMRMRGKWRAHSTGSGQEIPAMPTLHPAYLLRNPAHKKLAWYDFLEVKAKLTAL